MARHNGIKLLFFIWLCSLCSAQDSLTSDELGQVRYQVEVDEPKEELKIVQKDSASENDGSRNMAADNDIEETFRKEDSYCLGCVINVPIDQPAVKEMVEEALVAMDKLSTSENIHAKPRILGVQKQVVNGIQYYIQMEVTLSSCAKSESPSREVCDPVPDVEPLICEVTFLHQPWVNPKPRLMVNNCTDANSDNSIENFTPDDLLAVERSSGVENTLPPLSEAETAETTTMEGEQETTTVNLAVETTPEERSGRNLGMMKTMDSSENDLINELADIAVRTLREVDPTDSHKEVIDIIDAKKQIVNGLLYHLVVRVGTRSCPSNAHDSSSEEDSSSSSEEVEKQKCQNSGWTSQSICNVQLHRSWAGDTPYKAKVVKSECEESWEQGSRDSRELPDSSSEMSSALLQGVDWEGCVEKLLTRVHNIVPKEKVAIKEISRKVKDGMTPEMFAVVESNSEKWIIPKPDGKIIMEFKPKVMCNAEPEKTLKGTQEDVVVAPEASHVNDEIINEIAAFAVQVLDKTTDSASRRKVSRIISATNKPDDNGILSKIEMEIVETDCDKNQVNIAGCNTKQDQDPLVCQAEIWHGPWSPFKAVKTLSCGQRSKREAVYGGLSDADKDSPGVKEAIAFALAELDKRTNSPVKQQVVEVLEAKTQVVSGIAYHLKLALVPTTCKKNEPTTSECSPTSNEATQTCSVKVWSRPWLNSTELMDAECTPAAYKRTVREAVLGGVSDADKDSPGVKEAIAFALAELDKRTNSPVKQQVVEVLEAKTQVVAGIAYHLKLALVPTTCKKNEPTTSECSPTSNEATQTCSVKIWSRPWLNSTEMTDALCTPTPLTRSARNAIPGGLTDADMTSPVAKEALSFALSELDKRSNAPEKLGIVETLEAKQQIVSGVLYHFKLALAPSNCQKSDASATDCKPASNKATQTCSVKVWSQPWLKRLEVTDVECSPSPAKRSVRSLGGGLSDADINDRYVKEALELGLAEVSKSSNGPYKLGVVETIEAKKQVVAGMLYHFKLGVAPTSCRKSEASTEANCKPTSNTATQICSFKVWTQPWLNRTEVQNVVCNEPTERTKRSLDPPGGLVSLNKDDPELKNAVRFALPALSAAINSMYEQEVVDVLDAKVQIVAGKLYHVTLMLAATDRLKESHRNTSATVPAPTKNNHVCRLKVLYQAWLNKREIRDIGCKAANPQISATPSRETSQVITIDDLSDPYVQEIANFARGKLDEMTNNIYVHKIVKVVEATKEEAAGTLFNVKLELILTKCKKREKDHSSCEAQENRESEHCSAQVWDRPWLKSKKIKHLQCGAATLISTENANALHAESIFNEFATRYNKSYRTEVERNKRLRIFQENLNLIKELQDNEQGSATYGPTIFADLTREEFQKYYLGLRPDLRQENSVPMPHAEIPNIDLPKSFDWRDQNVVTPVKNQGLCGSCWAFSVTGNIEGQYAIKNKRLLSFSEQELVDCDKLDAGCQGGLPDNAYRAIEQLGGLETEQDYPYDGRGEKCSFNKKLTQVQVRGGLNISSDETDMAKWLVQNGPIAIGINANAMQFYMGGVSHPFKFLCSPSNLDHGVLIVGFGEHRTSIRKKLLPYWLIKNSWGTFWGEKGYYRVYRGDGTCGINTMASSAVLE